MEELERVCCIRGYHVYKEIWEVAAGEVLVCEREPHNALDRYVPAACQCLSRWKPSPPPCLQERLHVRTDRQKTTPWDRADHHFI